MQWKTGKPAKDDYYLVAIKVMGRWVYEIGWWENNKWTRQDSEYGDVVIKPDYWCQIYNPKE